jgi:hypothetical protein
MIYWKYDFKQESKCKSHTQNHKNQLWNKANLYNFSEAFILSLLTCHMLT